MRRSLVLTDESARHPFRAALPPHVCRTGERGPTKAPDWRITLADVRGFATAYVSCVVGITAFIV